MFKKVITVCLVISLLSISTFFSGCFEKPLTPEEILNKAYINFADKLVLPDLSKLSYNPLITTSKTSLEMDSKIAGMSGKVDLIMNEQVANNNQKDKENNNLLTEKIDIDLNGNLQSNNIMIAKPFNITANANGSLIIDNINSNIIKQLSGGFNFSKIFIKGNKLEIKSTDAGIQKMIDQTLSIIKPYIGDKYYFLDAGKILEQSLSKNEDINKIIGEYAANLNEPIKKINAGFIESYKKNPAIKILKVLPETKDEYVIQVTLDETNIKKIIKDTLDVLIVALENVDFSGEKFEKPTTEQYNETLKEINNILEPTLKYINANIEIKLLINKKDIKINEINFKTTQNIKDLAKLFNDGNEITDTDMKNRIENMVLEIETIFSLDKPDNLLGIKFNGVLNHDKNSPNANKDSLNFEIKSLLNKVIMDLGLNVNYPDMNIKTHTDIDIQNKDTKIDLPNNYEDITNMIPVTGTDVQGSGDLIK